jgi:imidazoleglycerol-phosphate dehydratase
LDVVNATVIARSASASSVSTGVSALDRLVELAARAGRFEIRLELAPAEPEAEVDAAGAEVGRSLLPLLSAPGAKGHGVGTMATDEALATVVLECSGRPLVLSNVDLASSHVGGLETDLASRFLAALAEAAGLTMHVRLVEGEESGHVVDAIFKALGVALADAITVVRD